MRSWMVVGAALAGALPTQAMAQSDQTVVTGSAIDCSDKPAASYGPAQRFDGIMFSFIDGVLFTPCQDRAPCDAATKGASLDLHWPGEAPQPVLDRAWNGWGYYRLTFEGRRGSWDKARPCDLDAGDFYEIGRVISATRIADPPRRPKG